MHDEVTGLTWQQSGSDESMTFAGAGKYVDGLNAKNFAGYNDWRLPTLEEATSLMEPTKSGDLYVNPVFDDKQWYIWTSDISSAGRAWYVGFSSWVIYKACWSSVFSLQIILLLFFFLFFKM